MLNIQNQKNRIGVGLLIMLAASPLTVNFAQAETLQPESEEFGNKRLQTLLTEKVVDGKLQVRHYQVADNVTPENIREFLHLREETFGWALIQGKAYNAGIVLFDGKAFKSNDNVWRIDTKGIIEIGGRHLDLDLKGRAHDSNVLLHGSATSEDLEFRVVFSGKVVQSGEENTFAIAFNNAGLKSFEESITIQLFQVGSLVEEQDGNAFFGPAEEPN